MTDGGPPLLQVSGLELSYGALKVLHGVSLHVAAGEVVALIGRNGTGKSTTLGAIFGLAPVERGDVVFDGVTITNRTAAENVRHGLALAPQASNEGRGIFHGLSVQENLELGALHAGQRGTVEASKERVFQLFPVLRGAGRLAMAGLLSGGQQQMLAVGIALMSQPRLLLLDEPTSGLSPAVANLLMQTIGGIAREHGIAVLIVEQNIRLALEIARRVYVMRTGRVVREDTGAGLLASENLLAVL